MAFKVLFLAHAPNAEAEKHRCVIETSRYYKLFVVVVRNQEQAIEVCKKIVKKEGIQSILLTSLILLLVIYPISLSMLTATAR